MAKRRRGSDSATYTSNGQVFLRNGTLIDAGLNRQPASLGRLHEIDLGPDSKLRNIARTEAAQKRLENGEAEVEEGAGKVRLGRDGKPRRGKRRRNSEDIKRDKLVEEVMRESRCEHPELFSTLATCRILLSCLCYSRFANHVSSGNLRRA